MRRVELLFLALVVALCCSTSLQAQIESSLASRITDALKDMKPGWKWIAAVENRIPLVPSEKRILVAIWESPRLGRITESVHVSIYEVENSGEAIVWLKPVRDNQVAKGWQVSTYPIGEEGYLSKFQNGKRFEIQFRRGKIVGTIAGNDLSLVREFSKCIVDRLPAK